MWKEYDMLNYWFERGVQKLRERRGSAAPMEMVQGAILAVAIGIIFKSEITEFVNNTFKDLNG